MLTYNLREANAPSLYEALYRAIRADIESGIIAANEKLPSKRALAKHLGVSVITVENAYGQLLAEGYVHAVERKGYFACRMLPLGRGGDAVSGSAWTGRDAGDSPMPTSGGAPWGTAEQQVARPASAPAKGGTSAYSPLDVAPSAPHAGQPGLLLADFTGAAQAHGAFPYATWAKTVRAALAEENEASLSACLDPAGSPRLRAALAAYLHGFRGMSVSPDQIVIGAGAQTLYSMLVQLLGRDKAYAIENPGYRRLARIYASNGVRVVSIGLDALGVRADELAASGAQVLHCMPSHQFPLGLVTSASRRYELLAWAAERPDRFIIEDDYDCEFRMAGRPIPSLQSIDVAGSVIYANTFTKSLGSVFRIGYMVLPPALVQEFRDKLGFYSSTVGAIDQVALARFIETGDYERHVNRLRSRARRVQDELIEALQSLPHADKLTFSQVGAGLHFLMGVESQKPEAEIARLALAQGVALSPLSDYRMAAGEGGAERPTPTFVMSFGGIDRTRIPQIADAVEAVLRSV